MNLRINQIVLDRILQLLNYIEHAEFLSYDYVDWYSQEWGRSIKQWAYRTEPFGNLLFSLPLLACEWWLPFLRSFLGIQKNLAPITVAHHGLACLELYKHTKQETFLQSALRDSEILVNLAIPNAKGLCWGFPFILSTNVGIIPDNLPTATQTAYGFELFEQLWSITKQDIFLDRLIYVANAMEEEYINLPRREGLASTYFGRQYGDIINNAISYRIFILTGAMAQGVETFKPSVMGLLGYLLSQQQPDGSWLYGERSKNRFIDHYHTCFIIKNLHRANNVLKMNEVAEAVDRGLNYYWANLFDERGLPKPFSRSVRFNIVQYESYDFAECLGLFALFGPHKGFNEDKLNPILKFFMNEFWQREGTIKFRNYRIPTVKGPPYFRFGMSAALLSMAQLLNSPIFNKERCLGPLANS